MQVAYFDFGSTNPFQERFYSSVAKQGVTVKPLRYRAMLPILQSSNCDILHLDWIHPFYKSGNLFSSCCKALMGEIDVCLSSPKRVVWTAHNLYSHDSFMPQALEKAFIGRICRKVDAIEGFTRASLRELNQEFRFARGKRQYVIPHGHYIDDYGEPLDMAAARERLNLPQNDRIVLYFGGLRDNKGVRDLVEAFKLIRGRGGISLLIAGGAETESMRRFLDGVSSEPKIFLHRKFVPSAEVPTYFGAADFAVLPFQDIFNSGSAILATSMKKCVVLPNLPVFNEVIPECGRITYARRKVDDLAATLITAVELSDLEKRGVKAHNEIKQRLDWDLVGSLAVKMYGDLL